MHIYRAIFLRKNILKGELTMEILEYVHDYKDNVNNLMHEILVEEYGFSQFSEEILNAQNEEYVLNNNKLWLAMENGEIVGTTGIVELPDNHALLKKVYVKETHRGKGIAQQLLDQCLVYAKQLGFDDIILVTYQRLERARAFYSKNGFIPYYNGYERPQGEEIRFRLDLKETA